MKIIRHTQKSEEWMAWRKKGVGGSDVSKVMGCSPYGSAFDLWEEKTGRRDGNVFMNPAMARGVALEQEAREIFMEKSGILMAPACVESDEFPFMRSSLDGLSLDKNSILEIKCPGEDNHEKYVRGEIPDHIRCQIQYNMYVSESDFCYFVSYRPESDTPISMHEIPRDEGFIDRLVKSTCDFWECVTTDTPPARTAKEHTLKEYDDAVYAAIEYRKSQATLKKAQADSEYWKNRLLDENGETNGLVSGMKITQVVKKGNIDWKRVKKEYSIGDADIEEFRGKESSYWKITDTEKEKE